MLKSQVKGTRTRTHDEFMADQIRYEQHRYEKLKQVIENEEVENSTMFKPQLSKGSIKMITKKKVEGDDTSAAIHDRLYSTKQEKL